MLNLKKGTYKKPTVNTIINGKNGCFFPKNENESRLFIFKNSIQHYCTEGSSGSSKSRINRKPYCSGKEPACRFGRLKRHCLRNPWRRKWQHAQYSCLENPMDRGAWRTATHGVAKSQTRLNTKNTRTQNCKNSKAESIFVHRWHNYLCIKSY